METGRERVEDYHIYVREESGFDASSSHSHREPMMKAPGCKRCRRSRSLLMVTLLLTAVLLLSVLMLLQSPPNDTTKVAQAPGQAEEGGRNVGAFEAEMRRRVRRLSAHCRAMRTSGAMVRQKQGSKFANLFLLERRSLLWCPVFKAASTAWMENFFRLTGMAEVSGEWGVG